MYYELQYWQTQKTKENISLETVNDFINIQQCTVFYYILQSCAIVLRLQFSFAIIISHIRLLINILIDTVKIKVRASEKRHAQKNI